MKRIFLSLLIAATESQSVVWPSGLELAESSGEFSFGPPRTAVLKGLAGEHLLYPVVWHDDPTAIYSPIKPLQL